MVDPRLAGLGLLVSSFCSTAIAAAVNALQQNITERPLSECPGYKALNAKTTSTGLVVDLELAGAFCNTYGTDLTKLKLEVTYEDGECCAKSELAAAC